MSTSSMMMSTKLPGAITLLSRGSTKRLGTWVGCSEMDSGRIWQNAPASPQKRPQIFINENENEDGMEMKMKMKMRLKMKWK
jgi:hypothetical protein